MKMTTFEIRARWTGGLDGVGSLTGEGLESKFSVPKDLKGPGLGTNPEELLLGAAASCFLITTAAILKRLNVSIANLSIQSQLEVEVGLGIDVRKLIHRPTVTVKSLATPEVVKTVNQALSQAEQYCLISKAIRGNVAIEVVAIITGE